MSDFRDMPLGAQIRTLRRLEAIAEGDPADYTCWDCGGVLADSGYCGHCDNPAGNQPPGYPAGYPTNYAAFQAGGYWLAGWLELYDSGEPREFHVLLAHHGSIVPATFATEDDARRACWNDHHSYAD